MNGRRAEGPPRKDTGVGAPSFAVSCAPPLPPTGLTYFESEQAEGVGAPPLSVLHGSESRAEGARAASAVRRSAECVARSVREGGGG